MTSAPRIRLGFWPPVYGNWLMSSRPEDSDASFDYTRRATLLAERLGFETLLLAEHFINPNAHGTKQLDAWTTAAALAALTSRIEILTAVKPGLRAPGVIAKMGANIDRISQGRFAVNLVSAWWPPEYVMLGAESLPHDERYARAAEYIEIIRGLWTTDRFNYAGRFYRVADATIAPKPVQLPHPPIYVGGESEAGRALGAKVADIFLINGRPLADVPPLIDDMRRRAAAHGRTLRFGMSAFIVCRATEAAARAEFERLCDLRQLVVAGADPEVQMMKTSPLAGRRLGSNGSSAAGLTGTPAAIAERMRAFAAAGIETFLLQFHPVLEELERFGAEISPLLAEA